MLSRRLRYFRFHLRGRGGSWLALLGQVIAVVGLPMPAASAKDLSTPFPCQHRACGCLSAGDCWTSCCCFSAAQRLAWAREHDAEVSDTLVREAEEETARPACGDEESGDTKDRKPCCTKHSEPPLKAKTASGKQSGWLLVIQARRCQGGSGEEGDVCPTASPEAPQLWRYEWTFVNSLPGVAESAERVAHLPPAPPPRD